MADKDYKIEIKTTADTSGADEAEEAIRGVEGAADRAGEEMGGMAAGAGQAAQSIDQMERELEQLQAEIRKIPVGTREFDAMTQKIAKVQGKLQEAGKTAARSGAMVSGRTGGFGNALQMAGYQVGDFAVQVEMGTSALRALSMQGSQVLGAFGPYGALAGAALAVGAAVYSGMNRGKEGIDELSDGVQKAVDDYKDLQKTIAELSEQEPAEIFTLTAERIDIETNAIKRNIEAQRERVQMADKLRARQIAQAIKQVETARDSGALEADDAEQRLQSLRQQQKQNEIDQIKRLAQLDRQAAEAELSGIEEKRQTAEQQRELYVELAELLAEYRKILDQGGRGQGTFEPLIEVSRRAERMAEIEGRFRDARFPIPETTAASFPVEDDVASKTLVNQAGAINDALKIVSKESNEFAEEIKDMRMAIGDMQIATDQSVGNAGDRQEGEDLLNQRGTTTGQLERARSESEELLTGILSKIVEGVRGAADSPQVAQLEQLIEGGIQSYEESAAMMALRQVIQRFEGDDSTRAELYRQFTGALNSSVTRENQLIGVVEGLDRQLKDSIRRIQRLESNQGTKSN